MISVIQYQNFDYLVIMNVNTFCGDAYIHNNIACMHIDKNNTYCSKCSDTCTVKPCLSTYASESIGCPLCLIPEIQAPSPSKP